MNNRTWEIKELSQEEIRKHIVDYKYDGQPQEVRYCGQTYFTEQTIYLDKDLHPEEKNAYFNTRISSLLYWEFYN